MAGVNFRFTVLTEEDILQMLLCMSVNILPLFTEVEDNNNIPWLGLITCHPDSDHVPPRFWVVTNRIIEHVRLF